MRAGLRPFLLVLGLLPVLNGYGAGEARLPAAAPDDAHVQLFSGVDQSVASVGETFVFWVELYASPASAADVPALYQAFADAAFASALENLELVRGEIDPYTPGLVPDSMGVVTFSRRFLLRSRRTGVVHVPAFQVRFRGATVETLPYTLHIYQATPDFFDTRESVLPVVAEYRAGQRLYARIGSAFLIAPDAIVTSYHVVMDADVVRLTLPDGRRLATRRAWVADPARDVVVLHVNPEAVRQAGLRPLQLAPPADAVQQAHAPPADDGVVFTYGWPSGLQRSTAGVHYRDQVLQHHKVLWMSTNPVRPGDSGGPLLDRAGRVIGVVSAGTVIYPGRDVLTEEVSIATDPRPALGQMLLVKRPRRLRSLWRDPAVAAQPYARAMRLSSLLAIRGPQTPRVEEVLAQLQDAVNEAPYDAGLLFMQGSVYQMLGTSEAAAEAYRAALAVFDGHFPASYMLGLYHLQRHDYREALAQFAHTRRHRPYRHLAAYGLAQALMRRLQYREAEAELRRVLRYDPDFAPALFALAYCHLGQEDRPRAEQVAVKLAEQHPRWAAQLHQVLAYPIFLPTVLRPLPPAPFRTAAPAPLP